LNIENIRIGDNEVSSRPADAAVEGFQWTQEKDEILINNYPSFESLGKHACF